MFLLIKYLFILLLLPIYFILFEICHLLFILQFTYK